VPGYRLELTPFGGIKDSGSATGSVLEAMKSFTNTKTYSLPWGSAAAGWRRPQWFAISRRTQKIARRMPVSAEARTP